MLYDTPSELVTVELCTATSKKKYAYIHKSQHVQSQQQLRISLPFTFDTIRPSCYHYSRTTVEWAKPAIQKVRLCALEMERKFDWEPFKCILYITKKRTTTQKPLRNNTKTCENFHIASTWSKRAAGWMCYHDNTHVRCYIYEAARGLKSDYWIH